MGGQMLFCNVLEQRIHMRIANAHGDSIGQDAGIRMFATCFRSVALAIRSLAMSLAEFSGYVFGS
jgi:hypothetical protein